MIAQIVLLSAMGGLFGMLIGSILGAVLYVSGWHII